MGFAQKLGEFTEGFAGGLLPGLQAGSRIAGHRQTRALAQKRENRLATAAERSVITDMFSRDPMGAITLAESKGFTNLASSLRRKTSGDVKTSITGALAGATMGPTPAPTDFSLSGLQAYNEGLRKREGDLRTGAGGMAIARAGIPEGFDNTPEVQALERRGAEYDKMIAETGRNITAMDKFIADIQGINFLSADAHDQIDMASNSYAMAMNATPEQVIAYKETLREAAEKDVVETFRPIIESADIEGLDQLESAYTVMGFYPELDALLTIRRGTLQRELDRKGMTPAEQQRKDAIRNQIQILKDGVKFSAIVNPLEAEASLEQVANLMKELGYPAETVEAFRNTIPGQIRQYSVKDRRRVHREVLMMLLDPMKLGHISQMTGIPVGDLRGAKIENPSTAILVNQIVDLIMGEEEAIDKVSGGEEDKNKLWVENIVEILNSSKEDLIKDASENFLENTTEIERNSILLPLFKSRGWEWDSENNIFRKISMSMQEPAGFLPPSPGAPPAGPSPQNQQQLAAVTPFLGGQGNV